MGKDCGVEAVYIPKSTDSHDHTVELEHDANHVLKVNPEDRKGIQSYHEDRSVLEN